MKYAYPNFSQGDLHARPGYNLNKWLDAMRNIYTSVHFGRSFKEAFGQITNNWDINEQNDFESWISYYKSDNQNKYKKASEFYVNDNIPGYFIPNHIKPKAPEAEVADPTVFAQKSVNELESKQDKRFRIEEQRKKIIGRLNAAARQLTSAEGHEMAGDEYEKLLNSMYELIKQIHTVNKISLSNQLYYDLIIRQANKLSRSGFNKSASFLVKLAQNNVGKLDASGPIPQASQDTGVAGGTLDNPASPIAESPLPVQKPSVAPKPTNNAVVEFLRGLETANITDSNYADLEDPEVSLDDLTVEAQLASTDHPLDPIPMVDSQLPKPISPEPFPPTPAQEDLEVSLPEQGDNEEIEIERSKDIDNILDTALASITIQDVVSRLESVITIFRNRQLSRELMIVDMMLHKLGLITLVPELGDANQKILESGSYVLSRLEKITSQLNGTISSSQIDLTHTPEVNSEQVKRIRQNMEADQERNKINKERRRRLDNEQMEDELNQSDHAKLPVPSQQTPAQEITSTPKPVLMQ